MPILWLAATVGVLAFALIVLAGNAATPDLACGGWSDCSGWSALSERSGTVAAWRLGLSGTIGLLALGLVALARIIESGPGVARAAAWVTVMAGVQLAAIAAATSVDTAPRAAAMHLGATAALLAFVVYLIARALPLAAPSSSERVASLAQVTALARAQWFVAGAGIAVFAVLTSGAYLANSSDALTCTAWPTCGTGLSVSAIFDPGLAMFHREMVALAGVLLIGLAVTTVRSGMRVPALRVLLLLLIGAYVFEVAIGGLSAVESGSRLSDSAHFALAGVVWILLVGFAVVISDSLDALRSARMAAGVSDVATQGSVARDYFRVMKPGIMVLLLTTTLGAMLVAGAGSEWPSLGLILATLLGGVLASGGASALNCYLDRDIDIVMARTRKRPLPTGRLTPAQVRNFGLALSTLAVIWLALVVNPLAALLALAGNLYYVVLYTRFLKRSTPQNIVIGGGAGAFPPLVGWAAVTGSLTLTPVLLFALIYYWTPPHFWSLALLKARDYERASIPMLPVTHGPEQTRKFILIYSFQLLAVTLLLVPASGAGALYLGAALLLGAIFVGYAARMYHEGTARLAWPLFKYSNYYLALILLALVVDRALSL